MLKISPTAYASLRRHGEETYPNECCGALLGRFGDDGAKTVSRAVRCGNTREDSPQNRYNIDPKELIRIQREGRERGEDVVGFYHSHPDHDAYFSATDRAQACSFDPSEPDYPETRYIVMSVRGGKFVRAAAFVWDAARREFVETTLEVL